MKNAVLTEKFIVEGTFGDKEVYISRCIPKVPNGTQVILLHGVHSTANLKHNNKFYFLAELLSDRGYAPWLVETSRLVRNRQDYAENASDWIVDAFGDKTFHQEQEDVFRAIHYILNDVGKTPVWLWGFSLGGTIALSAVAGEMLYSTGDRFVPESLILSGTGLNAYPEITESMMKRSILSTLYESVSTDILTRIQAGSIISFRGEHDEIFSEKSCLDLLNKINLPSRQKIFQTIKSADHSFRLRDGKKTADIMEEMMDFVIKFNRDIVKK